MSTLAILRTLRTSAAVVGVVAVGLSAAACGATTPTAAGAEATSPAEAVTSPTAASGPDDAVDDAVDDGGQAAPAAPAPAEASSLLDGTRQVDVQTYTGGWLVPTVEGGLAVVDQPSDAEVPSSWVFTPVSPGASQHLVVTQATTDGNPSCLRVVDVETVALASCDPADTAQLMTVASLDRPEQVNITTSLGSLVTGPEGQLAVAADPSEPNSVFTLVERGVSTRS